MNFVDSFHPTQCLCHWEGKLHIFHMLGTLSWALRPTLLPPILHYALTAPGEWMVSKETRAIRFPCVFGRCEAMDETQEGNPWLCPWPAVCSIPPEICMGSFFPGLWHHHPVEVAAALTINPWLLLCAYLIYSFVINTTNYNSPQLISCATCPLLGPDYFLMCKDHVQNMEDLMMILDISKVERSENGGWRRTSPWDHYVSVLDP